VAESAGSAVLARGDRSLSELGDPVKKIVVHYKRGESRELAARIQAATHELIVQTYGRVYDRGVRHSLLVVLIGATMPAVLVEVGFISSIKEEALLKKAEHRQKVAEAIYKGIVNYARSLSHYSMASAED
jgi:N-acetylmuramoyl-L-alanine amidase